MPQQACGRLAGLKSFAGCWAIAISSGKSGWVDAIWSFAVGAAGVAMVRS
ncbi:hypothetical protein X727_30215 [Mesorhizobium sp. L103C119B0]|nr:hypothetical protein X766_05345 [Mesorhizobium sp. LSJC255A00]ESX32886.1 hypothetical protein X765_04150 [Mesorhizobium sp. LSHC440B00]ESX40043.1 hypothetical protein X763_04265 [Mesorhizobium sp. LSHC432A00]ESX79940.1 hypothetical protein X757_01020 [Mesorhizobium sp. LSHC414A00]ESY02770.1 hypothetical protein X755_01755 [Mesorhizobium sp. LNJC405B00]ESY22396.1 hypothetical protein X751_06370 [Mesorhizobium sp. LNJC395A00]ESY31607.1 hypothetical protein X749_08175 [Mesorhizobium sp. LNJC3